MSGAFWSAVAGGAQQYEKQADEQRQEDQWEQRYQRMKAMEAQQAQDLEDFKRHMSPPETSKRTVTGPDGRPMVENLEATRPSADDVRHGGSASWTVTGTEQVPRKLGERNYQSGTSQVSELYDQDTGETVRKLGEGPKWDPHAAEIADQRVKLASESAGASGARGASTLVWETQPDGSALGWNRKKSGDLEPAVNPATGEQMKKQAWRPRAGFDATGTRQLPSGQSIKLGERDEIGPAYPKNPIDAIDNRKTPKDLPTHPERDSMQAPVFVDPSSDQPLAQFASPPMTHPSKPSAWPDQTNQPKPPPAGSRSPYPEGTVLKGPDGRRYIVRNGTPVPA